MSEPTRIGKAQADLLVQVHAHLRDELSRILEAVDQVAIGAADPDAARSMINALTMRQNFWTLGSFCAAYCRMLSMHHGIEDEAMFPGLLAREPSLGPVIARLMADHELVAEILVELDESLVDLVDGGKDVESVRARAQQLSDLLLPHLAYEEGQLLPVIERLTDRVV